MKASIINILLLATALQAWAGDFDLHWVYAQQTDSTSHVWFRRLYTGAGRPQYARLTVASTGLYKLYVNECNVGTALFYPSRSLGDTTAIAMSFDITQYMRADSNVIAVLFSPACPSKSQRQVSVVFYGFDHEDKPFSYSTDGSWLCRLANSSITADGGERIDGRRHNAQWKAATIYDLALWKHAMERERGRLGRDAIAATSSEAAYASHIENCNDIAASESSDMQLPTAIYGFCRVTMRGARRGQRLSIGNLHYICSGEIDEQAYPLFSIGAWRTIPLSSSTALAKKQFTDFEAISITNKQPTSYHYER